jgi:signal transduction histidine kinase
MPLLRPSRRIARGEKITRADVFDNPAELVVAQFRLVLCALGLFAIYIDPLEPASYATAAQVLIIAYSVFAIAVLVIAAVNSPGPTAGYLIHTTDIILLAATFLVITQGRPNPLIGVFTVFLLIAAALRWDWRGVIATTAALAVVIWGVGAMLSATPSGSDGLELSRALACSVYLIVAGGMLAYLSGLREHRRSQLSTLADWPSAQSSHTSTPSLATILAHCARILEVPRVLVLWEEPDEPFVNIAVCENDGYEHRREMAGTFGNFIGTGHNLDCVFLTDNVVSGRVLVENGPTRLKTPIIDPRLTNAFRICSVATAPIAGSFCNGRVFILDRGIWSEFQLVLTKLVASRIALELDRQILQRQTEEAAAARERMRLTRDLHDGILQSLTAAGIQLRLLRDGKNEGGQARIDTVKQLLKDEQIRIRNFVRQTLPKQDSRTDVVLRRELEQALSEASRLWDCATSLCVDPQDVRVPTAMVGQLSLMIAEAVSNGVRHGQASTIDVTVQKTNEQLLVIVRDNGRGFDSPAIERDQENLVA